MNSYVPRRGDMVWLSFGPQAGREQAGRRPALVISPSEYNERVSLALVCPITNHSKGYPFEVAIPHGLAVKGYILADHVKSQDWRVRRAEKIDELPESTVREVLDRLRLLLQA